MAVLERFYRRPALLAGIIGVLTLFFAIGLSRIRIDSNNIRFLPEGNAARAVSEYIDETFGGQVMILVGLERRYRQVFDPEFLALMKKYAGEIETVEFVGSVNSIMTTSYIYGDSEAIYVTDLVPEDFSGSAEEIAALRRRIASWDLYEGALVSADGTATQIVVNLDVNTEDSTKPEVTAALVKIRDRAREMFAGYAEVYVTGMPVINATINESIIADNLLLIPLVVAVVLAVLFLSLRRAFFVFLPLLAAIVAIIWAVGATALLGIKLSLLSTFVPVILIAVGSAYGIHVVAHYGAETAGRVFSAEEHRALVLSLTGKLLKPVFLAALTTLAGFVSFCFTPIVPMREFGFCASFGVLSAFAVAVTLLPALLILRGPAKTGAGAREKTGKAAGFVRRLDDLIAEKFSALARKKVLVFGITAIFAALSVYGFSLLVIDNSTLEFFRDETDISRSDRFVREHFGGSRELVLVTETGTTEQLLHPDTLSAVDALHAWLSGKSASVGKTAGFTDVIKRVNQVFNAAEDPAGIRPRAAFADTAFADDSDFGFGFGSFDAAPDSGGESEMAEPGPAWTLEGYTAADLIALLDTAAGSAPGMTGNDLVRELKRLVNYSGYSWYEIPRDPARYGKSSKEELGSLISNYLVLLSGDASGGYSSDPLEPTAIKSSIQLRATGGKETREVIETIRGFAAENFPEYTRIYIGGSAVQEMAVSDLILYSQLVSIAVSVLSVFLIILVSEKSAAAGLIGTVPLALAIPANFAAMGFLGINLNVGTALIASLAVGIGIDYTIHFMDSFRREYRAGGDFLRRTFAGSGRAILVNALSVGAGFAVLGFSRFRIVGQLGILVAFSMVVTALASLTVIPALLDTFRPAFIYGKRNKTALENPHPVP